MFRLINNEYEDFVAKVIFMIRWVVMKVKLKVLFRSLLLFIGTLMLRIIYFSYKVFLPFTFISGIFKAILLIFNYIFVIF